MENRNSVYAMAYARKILGLTVDDMSDLKRLKKSKSKTKKINKHGNYDGTDIGFTSDSDKNPKKKSRKKRVKPIDRHGNYDGTDAGFTAELED